VKGLSFLRGAYAPLKNSREQCIHWREGGGFKGI
jgi:hypothetical protein